MRKGYAASNGWHGMLYGFAFFSVWVQLLGNVGICQKYPRPEYSYFLPEDPITLVEIFCPSGTSETPRTYTYPNSLKFIEQPGLSFLCFFFCASAESLPKKGSGWKTGGLF